MNVSEMFLNFLSYVLQIHNSSMDWQALRKYSGYFDTSNSKRECGRIQNTIQIILCSTIGF